MKKLSVKITGVPKKVHLYTLVDGQMIKLKKNQFGAYEGEFETEKENVAVEVFRSLELLGKLWWLYSLITFIVSVLGIFEPWYDRKCIALECKYVVSLKETSEIKINLKPLSKEGKAVDVESDSEVMEVNNVFYIDKKAKLRWRLMLAFKIIIWIVAIILAIYFIAINI